jgi:hypothetical protein
MKKFLCCPLLVFAFELQAEKSVNKTSDNSASHAIFDEKFNSSAKNYAGFTVGVGVNVGIHETKVEVNKEFEAPTKFLATTFGGVVSFGFQQNVCGNFMIGVEFGADMGGAGKQARIGGKIRDNSLLRSAYIEDYSKKEGILRQMFDNIGDDALDTRLVNNGQQYVLNTNVYGRFVKSMRCLGGTVDFISANNNNFMTADADINGVWHNPGGGYQGNQNAVFANFVGRVTINNINDLGNGNFQSGYEAVREFTREHFPAISDALGHMAEQPIAIMGNNALLGPSVQANGTVNNDGANAIGGVNNDILWEIPHQLSIFFNDGYIDSYENIGVNHAGRNIADLRREIEDLYNPDNSHIRPKLSQAEMQALSNFQNKTSFGVCPYAAIKIGYFFKEIQGCVYAKIGVTQLCGHVVAINDFIEKKDKFHMITPLIAVGMSKMLDQRCGISVEMSHALKTSKKQGIEWKGCRIENNVSVSKTSIGILLTYAF